ncbi:MAG: hypothetical protein EX272_10940 [Chromatiales bacterium]|nr:MAG: hypothetical protein EX272_10940 [Chromatiales bacterium]
MSTINPSDIAKLLAIAGFALFQTSCGSSSSESLIPPVNPPINPGNPPGVPQFVQVVAGDGNSSEIQNTISWALDPDATDYTVYWDNVPGVSDASSVVVPAASGTRYVIHSDVDVLAGNTYYYRVSANSAGGSSALSNEVAGTPQRSMTGRSLNDVAWNGTDTLVAVGDSGVILTSPNGTDDAWVDVSVAAVPEPLTGVTWEGVNSQFMIVGASSTVLTGDGTNWVQEDLSNIAGARNLQDVAWLGNRYIAVGNNGAIVTSNADGSVWTLQDAGGAVMNTSFNAVATDSNQIVIVGSNGTILNSLDAVTWTEQAKPLNNDLNDITWDGNQFVAAGSNDAMLTSPDGLTWTAHNPGTSDIRFSAVTQWDSGPPLLPVLGAVGSAGTFVTDPDADPGAIIRTGTTEQLGGLTWVDDGVAAPYFVIVGNDGTVMTVQYE